MDVSIHLVSALQRILVSKDINDIGWYDALSKEALHGCNNKGITANLKEGGRIPFLQDSLNI